MGGILSICTFYSVFDTPNLHNLHISAQICLIKHLESWLTVFYCMFKNNLAPISQSFVFHDPDRCLRNARCWKSRLAEKNKQLKLVRERAENEMRWMWEHIHESHKTLIKSINVLSGWCHYRANIKLYEMTQRQMMLLSHKAINRWYLQNMHK